jgi:hypothetical protein
MAGSSDLRLAVEFVSSGAWALSRWALSSLPSRSLPPFRSGRCAGGRHRRRFGHINSILVSCPSKAQPLSAPPNFITYRHFCRGAVVV